MPALRRSSATRWSGASSTAVAVPVAVRPRSNDSISWPTSVAGSTFGADAPRRRVSGKTVAPGAAIEGSLSWSTNAASSCVFSVGDRPVDIRLGHLRELVALAAGRRVGVVHVERDGVLAARDHDDRVRLDIALRPGRDRGHLDAGGLREDLQADDVGARHGDGGIGLEPDPVGGAHDAPGRDRVRRREVLVAEPDGARRLLLHDALAGRRERPARGDVDGHGLGRARPAGPPARPARSRTDRPRWSSAPARPTPPSGSRRSRPTAARCRPRRRRPAGPARRWPGRSRPRSARRDRWSPDGVSPVRGGW